MVDIFAGRACFLSSSRLPVDVQQHFAVLALPLPTNSGPVPGTSHGQSVMDGPLGHACENASS